MKKPDRILAQDLDVLLHGALPWEALDGRHILVTGASGFIGGHVVEALVWRNRQRPQAKLHLYALARDLQKLHRRMPWVDIPGEVTPIIQDVTVPCDLEVSVDFIIHAASPASPKDYLQKPVDTIRANTEGTRELLELARAANARLLFLSSGAVYGDNPGHTGAIAEGDFGSEDPLGPRACYGESKRLAETLCRAYYSQYGVDTRIARISHCYGPGMRLDDGRAISDLLADVLNDRDIELDSDGSASRPFCYISDTVLGLFHILLRGTAGHAYNVGETQEVSILELAERLIATAGKAGQLRVLPKARKGPAPAARSAGHFSIEKIRALGWAPLTPLDAGLSRLLQANL